MKIIVLFFFIMSALTDVAMAESSQQQELVKAKLLWEAKGRKNYRFVVSQECFCFSPAVSGPLEITVRNGKIRSLVYIGISNRWPGYSRGKIIRDPTSPIAITIPELFEKIERYLETYGGASLAVSYDEKDGHPVLFGETSGDINDGDWAISVKNFRRL